MKVSIIVLLVAVAIVLILVNGSIPWQEKQSYVALACLIGVALIGISLYIDRRKEASHQ